MFFYLNFWFLATLEWTYAETKYMYPFVKSYQVILQMDIEERAMKQIVVQGIQWNYAKTNYIGLIEYFNSVKWEEITKQVDVLEKQDHFLKIYEYGISKYLLLYKIKWIFKKYWFLTWVLWIMEIPTWANSFGVQEFLPSRYLPLWCNYCVQQLKVILPCHFIKAQQTMSEEQKETDLPVFGSVKGGSMPTGPCTSTPILRECTKPSDKKRLNASGIIRTLFNETIFSTGKWKFRIWWLSTVWCRGCSCGDLSLDTIFHHNITVFSCLHIHKCYQWVTKNMLMMKRLTEVWLQNVNMKHHLSHPHHLSLHVLHSLHHTLQLHDIREHKDVFFGFSMVMIE